MAFDAFDLFPDEDEPVPLSAAGAFSQAVGAPASSQPPHVLLRLGRLPPRLERAVRGVYVATTPTGQGAAFRLSWFVDLDPSAGSPTNTLARALRLALIPRRDLPASEYALHSAPLYLMDHQTGDVVRFDAPATPNAEPGYATVTQPRLSETPMNDDLVYLLLDENDQIVGDADTLEEAIHGAESLDAEEIILDRSLGADVDDGDLIPNNGRTAQEAWRRCYRLPPTYPGQVVVQRAGEPLRIDPDVVSRMTLAEATERLGHFLPRRRGAEVASLRQASKMKMWLLTVNSKLDARKIASKIAAAEKHLQRPIPQSVKDRLLGVIVYGLPLLPARTWNDARSEMMRLEGGETLGAWQDRARATDINLCVGASRECIESCLVYSGKNEADPYNVVSKAAKATMFLSDPEAFARVLMEHITLLRETADRQALDKLFVRLNVFSDVPWELVFPELFDHFGDVQFYDYTKVAERVAPRNYDLTFSYSGRNMALSVAEIQRDERRAPGTLERGPRRIAAVFAMGRHRYPKFIDWGADIERAQKGRRSVVRTDTLEMMPVVDGDLSDVRPYDPDRCIVALNYKNPLKKAGTAAERQERGEMLDTAKGLGHTKVERPALFIVPARKVRIRDDRGERIEVFAMPVTPRQEPDYDNLDPVAEDELLDPRDRVLRLPVVA